MKNIAFQLAGLCPRELNAAEMTMLELLCDAHEAVAKSNASASNQMAASMGQARVDLKSAIIASLSIIGGRHAPIAKIRMFLKTGFSEGGIVPGWGNSFYKDEPDPATLEIAKYIERNRPDWHRQITLQTESLHLDGKKIFPNIGCYTAVVAEIIGLPYGAELALVVLPRMVTWTKLFLKNRDA